MLFALLSPSFALSFVPAFYDQVAAAGDVDGDGLADVVAIDCSTGQLDLYAGSAGGLDDSPTFSLVTGGCTVAGVGDLDGDSFAEVIVGNASANGGDGELILYRGGSTAWTEWRRWSGQSGEGLGAVVAGIGDVDGDGIGDFAAVSHVAPSAADGLDRLSVWYGATVGDSAAWTWEQSVLAGFYSDSEPLWVGSGDVDGDGQSDLLWMSAADSGLWNLAFYGADGATGGLSAPTWQLAHTGAGKPLVVSTGTQAGILSTTLLDDQLQVYDVDWRTALVLPSTSTSCVGALVWLDEDGDGDDSLTTTRSPNCDPSEPSLLEADWGNYPDMDLSPGGALLSAGDINGDGGEDLLVLDGLFLVLVPRVDADGDDYEAGSLYGFDCDDGNAAIYPGATEVLSDGVDSDCDGVDGVEVTAAAQSPTFATAQEARALLAVPSSLSASAGLLSAMEQATTAQTLSVYNDNFVGDAAQYMTDNRRLTLYGATVAQQGVDGQGLRRDQEERIFDASNPDTDIREVDASLHLLLEGGSDPQSGVINRESSAETDTYASSFNGTQVAASSSDITNQEWGQLLRASGERELFSHTTRQWDEDYVDNYWLTTSRHFSFDGFEGQNSSYAVDYLATQMDFDRNDGDLTSTRDEQASIVYSSSSNTTEVSYTLSYAYLLYWDVLISQFVTTKQFDYTAQASDGTHLLSIENNATLQLCGVDFWTLMGGSSSEPVQDVGWATLDGSSFLVFLETWEEVVAPDQDGDGWMEGYGDCNDADAAVQPCAVELCNGVDDNCNGLLDDVTTGGSCWYVDGDGDGYGVTATALLSETQPAGYVADYGDCNDADTAISPGEAEFCDGRDEDCSGVVDDHPTDGSRWYRDQDVDGAGTPEDVVVACTEPEGYVATGGDCNDYSAAQSPFLDEVCDNLDNNCDGRLDENALNASTWYLDVDDDDFGALHLPIRSCDRPRSGSAISGDCNDLDPAIAPDYPEVCGDRIDNNCADGIDEGCPEEEEEENVEEKEEQQREPKARASEPACGCSTSAPTGMYAFPLFLLWRRRKP